MGKLSMRPTRRDAVVALMGIACVLLFTRMFDVTTYDSAVPYSHHVPDFLAPTEAKANSRPTYKPQKVPQHDDTPGPAPIPILPKREWIVDEEISDVGMMLITFSRRPRRNT